MVNFDFSSFNLPVTESDIVAAEAKYKKNSGPRIFYQIMSAVFVLLVGLAFIPATEFFPNRGIGFLVLFVVFAVLAGLAAYGGGKIYDTMRRELVRFDRLATANGLQYCPEQTTSNHTGLLFHRGHSNRSSNIFFTNEGQIYEFGNHRYVVGHGKHSQTYENGYIAIHLDRNLPHMVLDGRANNGKFIGEVSNLGIEFDKTQKLSLEGDFDKYFTLYAPKQYETDALYVFTPDLMALFIDNVHKFDAEIIDSRLYIYSDKFNFRSAESFEKILAIISAVGPKTGRRTDYYADSRVGNRDANVVAEGGRRLQRSKFGIVGFIIFMVIFFIFSIGVSILSSMSS